MITQDLTVPKQTGDGTETSVTIFVAPLPARWARKSTSTTRPHLEQNNTQHTTCPLYTTHSQDGVHHTHRWLVSHVLTSGIQQANGCSFVQLDHHHASVDGLQEGGIVVLLTSVRAAFDEV